MKLKYYLRGLGLGIAVTAIIMGILASKDRRMTDEEIIERAKQLGLIENTVLTEGTGEEGSAGQGTDDGQQGDDEGNTEGQTDDKIGADGNAAGPDAHTNAGGDAAEPNTQTDANGDAAEPNVQTNTDGDAAEPDTQASAGSNAAESGIQANANVAPPDNKTNTSSSVTASAFPKVLIISNGEGSYTVSKKLKEIGAVESAEDFDSYLCENGYDKKIRAGTYTIPVDASDEQMAKIVTGAKITE